MCLCGFEKIGYERIHVTKRAGARAGQARGGSWTGHGASALREDDTTADWQDGGLRKRRREDEVREEGERRLRPRDPGKRGKHQ